MTRSRTRLLAGAAIVLLGGLAAYVYRQYREAAQAGDVIAKAFVEGIRHPHPAAAVNPDAWKQLHTGMTKQQVLALLGEAPRQMQGESSKVGAPKIIEPWEFWEYGYVSAFGAPIPHDRAYAVYFDQDGRVSSFREPIDDKDSDETGAKR